MIRLSASGVPRAIECVGSLVLPRTKYHTDFADQGEERHADFESAIDVGDIDEALPEAIASLIQPGDKRITEATMAYDIVGDTARYLGHIKRRDYAKTLTASEIGGTIDLLVLGNGRAIVVDKKGFLKVGAAESNAQTMTYALMVARTFGLDEVTVAIFYVLGNYEIATIGVVQLEEHARKLRQLLVDQAAACANPLAWLKTGKHCDYCESFLDCPKQEELRLTVVEPSEIMRLESRFPIASEQDAADMFDLWERIKLLSTRIGSALFARAADGGFTTNDGRVFSTEMEEGNEKLDGDIVWKVVSEKFSRELADLAVERKATKKKLKEALKFTGAKSVAAVEREVLSEVKKRGGSRTETKPVTKVRAPRLKAVNE